MFKPKFSTTTELAKAIESIARRGLKLDADIQDAGLSCLARVQEHGDIGYLNRLFLSMPRGSRRNALAEWAAKYGKVKINLDKTSNKELPFTYWKEGNTDYAGAIEEPWFNCKPEKALDDEFDFVSKLTSLLAQAKKARESGKPIKGLEQLDKIEAFCALAPAPAMALPVEESADA